MRHIVIASHGRFAAGMKDTLEFVGGDLGIVDICAYIDDVALETQIERVFSGFSPEDEVLVLTDMMQGSVNQAFQGYMGDRCFLISGINIPCALELALSSEPLTKERIEGVIERAREQLVFVNDAALNIEDGDE